MIKMIRLSVLRNMNLIIMTFCVKNARRDLFLTSNIITWKEVLVGNWWMRKRKMMVIKSISSLCHIQSLWELYRLCIRWTQRQKEDFTLKIESQFRIITLRFRTLAAAIKYLSTPNSFQNIWEKDLRLTTERKCRGPNPWLMTFHQAHHQAPTKSKSQLAPKV